VNIITTPQCYKIRLKKHEKKSEVYIYETPPVDKQNIDVRTYFRVYFRVYVLYEKSCRKTWPNKENQPYGKKFQLKINKDVFLRVQFS
jgi:hypothetical protein